MLKDDQHFVYILANFHRTIFYTGMCNCLRQKLTEHKNGECEFTAKYKCFFLIYYEEYNNEQAAIEREMQIKNSQRQCKKELIEKKNPGMKDLSDDLMNGTAQAIT